MRGIEVLEKYFKGIDQSKRQKFTDLCHLYELWNQKINVISRKDICRLYERHVLPSLSVAKIISFKPNTRVMDAGTGGGFPGVPLAIMFPETNFVLLDSIGKKIKVVDSITYELGLKNVKTIKIRVEKYNEKFDFIISRAVTSIPEFIPLVNKNIHAKNRNNFPNGIFYLTGGVIEKEIKSHVNDFKIFYLKDLFEEKFFETKKLVYLNLY